MGEGLAQAAEASQKAENSNLPDPSFSIGFVAGQDAKAPGGRRASRYGKGVES